MLSGCTIYEPYAGSASVSLEMLERGFVQHAVLVERDPLIYAFWKAVFNNTEELCEKIETVEITIKTWQLFQDYRKVEFPELYSIVELGFAGLFFNRTNFSGIIGAGPIGGYNQESDYSIDCRFNKKRIIQQIKNLACLKEKVTVLFDDAIGFMTEEEDNIENNFCFVYIDPPYYAQGKKLYRYFYDESAHQKLARYILSKEFPWLISYDNHPEIKKLYSQTNSQPIYLDYSLKTSRQGCELLISNLVIPPMSFALSYCD
ncbi:MAG: D12 class N6 adenine-specific DNA methyltransferase [Pelotomaculum sp. PtaB.Bin013]|nr:MAG: D12 class N6 adenine-specific DNA methyltransferase [Pelotomaculum sp. PtaB.Bin013]